MHSRVWNALVLTILVCALACGDEAPLPDSSYHDAGPVEPCVEGESSGSRVCIQGTYVSCSALAPAHCGACGCDYQRRCNPSTDSCEPIRGSLHEPCDEHADCYSNNCGLPAEGLKEKVCLVEMGASCTNETCALCRTDGTHSVCARGCADDSEPAILDTAMGQFVCLVHRLTNVAIYRPACASGACVLSTESCWTAPFGTPSYCDAKPRSKGAYCPDHAACDTPLICSSRDLTCSAPNPNGTLCYDDEECASGLCQTTCVAGFADGHSCDEPSDCTSKRCEDGRCRAARLELGAACREGADCISTICDGVCRLRDAGEACLLESECNSRLCLEVCARSPSNADAFMCTSLPCSSPGYCTRQCYDADLPRGSECVHAEQCAPDGAEPSACFGNVCERARGYDERCTADAQCLSGICTGSSYCL